MRTLLTIQSVASNPAAATLAVGGPVDAALEPLAPSDEVALGEFFDGLSPTSRRFYSVHGPGRELAREHCGAIGIHDKLRLVVGRTHGSPISALVEFSFDVPSGDIGRYRTHGVKLDPAFDCRWGLCVTDGWQARGVATALACPSFEIARRFGRQRVILWGGVHAANAAGLGYYRKVGFAEIGRFTNNEGVDCVDMLRCLDVTAEA